MIITSQLTTKKTKHSKSDLSVFQIPPSAEIRFMNQQIKPHIIRIKGYAEVYMTSDPSNAIGHYFKMLVHLILAFGENAEENVKIAAAQFETVMVLSPRFQLNQDTKAIRDELKKSNPQLGQILVKIVTL